MSKAQDDAGIVAAVEAYALAHEGELRDCSQAEAAYAISLAQDARAALFTTIDAWGGKVLNDRAFDLARWGGLPSAPETAAHRMVARFRAEFDRLHAEMDEANKATRKAMRDDNRKASAIRKLAARIAELESK
jgi:hypothetical protein